MWYSISTIFILLLFTILLLLFIIREIEIEQFLHRCENETVHRETNIKYKES